MQAAHRLHFSDGILTEVRQIPQSHAKDEGKISPIASLLLAARPATVLMVPSSPPAWARAAQRGWLGPLPVTPRQYARERSPSYALLAASRAHGPLGAGLGRRPVASPIPRGAFPTGLWQNSV